MASEAEYERLYQLWVQKNAANGGSVTFAGANTPAQTYNELSSSNLTPQQIAELQARQSHYNRTRALQTINSEINTNNFTNPYNARSTASIAQFNSFDSLPGVLALAGLSNAFKGSSPTEIALIAALGGSAVLTAAIASALGIDLDKLLGMAALGALGVSAFGALQNHTDSQMVNLPETLENASSLAGMNAQFGEMPSSCSLFNELMGLLSGAFDGVMDFVDVGLDKLKGLLAPGLEMINNLKSAVTDALGQILGPINDLIAQGMAMVDAIASALVGGISAVLDSIKDKVMSMLPAGLTDMLGEIGNLADSLKGALGDIADQIASELAGLTDMLGDLAAKLKALAMAAAMLDPCQLAVLLNVGSTELKSAANAITSPVTNIINEVSIVGDPRADQVEVERAVAQAQEEAKTAPGVPQSPMTKSARIYSPASAYLHSSANAGGSTTSADAGGSLQQVAPSKFGTDEKFEVAGDKVEALPETGSDSASEVVEDKAMIAGESKAYKLWKSKHADGLRNALSGNLTPIRVIKKRLANGTFRHPSVREDHELLLDIHQDFADELKRFMAGAEKNLNYVSPDGKRIEAKEKIAMDNYNAGYDRQSAELVAQYTREKATTRGRLASLKSGVISNK